MSAYRSSAAITAVAVLAGTLGSRPDSAWYRSLRKPPWQPPGAAFGPVWTTLYLLIALASGRALRRMPDPAERRDYRIRLVVNLALNAAFSWIFFVGRCVRLAIVDQLALEASTLDLVRKAGRVDRLAGVMLVPYALWGAFALVLNLEVLRRNPAR